MIHTPSNHTKEGQLLLNFYSQKDFTCSAEHISIYNVESQEKWKKTGKTLPRTYYETEIYDKWSNK